VSHLRARRRADVDERAVADRLIELFTYARATAARSSAVGCPVHSVS
jgi:hypothetical protein